MSEKLTVVCDKHLGEAECKPDLDSDEEELYIEIITDSTCDTASLDKDFENCNVTKESFETSPVILNKENDTQTSSYFENYQIEHDDCEIQIKEENNLTDAVILNKQAIKNPKQYIRRKKTARAKLNENICIEDNMSSVEGLDTEDSKANIDIITDKSENTSNDCEVIRLEDSSKSDNINQSIAGDNADKKTEKRKDSVDTIIKDSITIGKTELEKHLDGSEKSTTNKIVITKIEPVNAGNLSRFTREEVHQLNKNSDPYDRFYYKFKKPTTTYLRKRQKSTDVLDVNVEKTDTVTEPSKKVTLKIRDEFKQITTDIDYNALIQEAFASNRPCFNLKSYHQKRAFFKCYDCKIAFLHLSQYQKHLRNVHSKKRLNITFELTLNQLYMIASSTITPKFDNLPMFDDDGCLAHICLQCQNLVPDIDDHETSKFCAGCYKYLECSQFEKHIITCTNYFKVTFPKTCLCKAIIESYSELEIHHEVCQMGAKTLLFQCFVCKYIYPTAAMLQQHQSTRHIVRSDEFELPAGTKQCKLCRTYLKPYEYHDCPEEKRRFMCKHCLKQFTQKTAYQMHEEKLKCNIQCEHCSTLLKYDCQLMRHLALKHDLGYALLYVCNICDFQLDSEAQIKYHMLNIHTINEIEKQAYTYRVLVARKTLPVTETGETSMSVTIDAAENDASRCDDQDDNTDKNDTHDEDDSDNDTTYTPRKSRRITAKRKAKKTVALAKKLKKTEDNNFEVPIIDSKENIKEALLASIDEAEKEGLSDIDAFIQNNSEITLSMNEKRMQYFTDMQKQKTIACRFCRYISSKPSALKRHENKHHSMLTSLLKEGLQKPFDEEEIAKYSIKIKKTNKFSDKQKFVCKHCNYTTVQRNTLIKHQRNCNVKEFNIKKHRLSIQYLYKDSNIECVCDCGLKFNDLTEFLVHLDKERDEYPCPFCKENQNSISQCSTHVQKHFKSLFINSSVLVDNNTYKIIRCLTCEKPVRPKEFYMHYKKHCVKTKSEPDESGGDASDDECEIIIDEKVNAHASSKYEPLKDEHVSGIINVLKTPLRYERLSKHTGYSTFCAVCSKAFTRRNDHKRHLIQHLLLDSTAKFQENAGLKCQICYLVLERSDHYKKHMRDHSYLPQYICSTCNKSFSDSSNFAKHKKVHNVNIVVCDICSRKFNTKTALIQHIKMHDTQNPFLCECKKIFYNEGEYKKHCRLKHIDADVKYSCHLCPQYLNSLKEKWAHLWTVHKYSAQYFECPFCVKVSKYRRYIDLKNHIQRVHQTKIMNNRFEYISLAHEYERGNVGLEEIQKLFQPVEKEYSTPTLLRFSVNKGLSL